MTSSNGKRQAMTQRAEILPLSLPPRGLSRVQAAAYIGISPSLFDILVDDGRMPSAKRINARMIWDRRKLDEAFEAIPDMESLSDHNPWDDDEYGEE